MNINNLFSIFDTKWFAKFELGLVGYIFHQMMLDIFVNKNYIGATFIGMAIVYIVTSNLRRNK